ncbi:MAG: hypothetical protein A3J97_04070 [Spirochaetes bacterium RIFOXYC1_FULL_54_7]|nr:MAG: hypothetical protein A3J97_04070 [Spirochaetes bacterium RIFOXYC1_FULL_54_7]
MSLEKQLKKRLRIGLLFLGRERKGYDPLWGEEIRDAILGFVERSSNHEWIVPGRSQNTVMEVVLALEQMKARKVEVLVVSQPTMSDGRFAPIIARTWQEPLVLWATPEKQTGDMISANSLVGSHVYGATLAQMGRTFEFVYGHPDDLSTEEQLNRSFAVLYAVRTSRRCTVGLIGGYAPGFIDFEAHVDVLSKNLGVELYQETTLQFLDFFRSISEDRIEAAKQSILNRQIMPGIINDEHLVTTARYYAAFQDWMIKHGIAALAIQCWPDHPAITGYWPYAALSLLATDGVAVAEEGDVDGALAATFAEAAGIGPVYLSDWLEHDQDSFVCWHTGVIPLQLCVQAPSDGAPTFAYHFNNKKPLVIEGTLREDMEVTVFRLWRSHDGYHMTAFEGTTEKPKRRLLGTNQLIRAKKIDVAEWFLTMIRLGMPHHVSIIEGNHIEILERICYHLGIAWHLQV